MNFLTLKKIILNHFSRIREQDIFIFRFPKSPSKLETFFEKESLKSKHKNKIDLVPSNACFSNIRKSILKY